MVDITNLLNEYAKNYHGDNEIISEDDLIRAVYYLNNLYIANELDVLMYLLALNLCNSYAKQVKDHDIYKFKKYIGTLLNVLNSKPINNVHVYMTNDKGNIYIFLVGDMQFSFHDEKKLMIKEEYIKEMKFDNVRKQPCAKSLFNMCFSSPQFNHEITTMGKPIKILANKLVEDYHNNIMTFDEIMDM